MPAHPKTEYAPGAVTSINVKVPAKLKVALHDVANESGDPFSHIVRSALREHVVRHELTRGSRL